MERKGESRMKKLFLLILAAVLCLSLCACKSSDYSKAMEQYAAGNYQQARDSFAALGNYESAAEMVKKCDYEIAMKLMKEENYTDALTIFQLLGDYEDSEEQIVTCVCKVAVAAGEKGKLSDAVALLTEYYEYNEAKAAFVEIILNEVTDNYLPHVEAANKSWNEYLPIWMKKLKADNEKTPVGQSITIPKVDVNAPQVIALQRSIEKANKTMEILRNAYNDEVMQLCEPEISNLVYTMFESADTIAKQYQDLDSWATITLFYGIQDNNAAKANNKLINAMYEIEDALALLMDNRK